MKPKLRVILPTMFLLSTIGYAQEAHASTESPPAAGEKDSLITPLTNQTTAPPTTEIIPKETPPEPEIIEIEATTLNETPPPETPLPETPPLQDPTPDILIGENEPEPTPEEVPEPDSTPPETPTESPTPQEVPSETPPELPTKEDTPQTPLETPTEIPQMIPEEIPSETPTELPTKEDPLPEPEMDTAVEVEAELDLSTEPDPSETTPDLESSIEIEAELEEDLSTETTPELDSSIEETEPPTDAPQPEEAPLAATAQTMAAAAAETSAPSQFIEKINTDRKVVALTFDDGGDDAKLEEVLANLKALNAKATFFLDGSTNPSLITRIREEGHEIGNHTYSHHDSTILSPEELSDELNAMDDIIQSATGESSKPYFRAPHGLLDEETLQTVGELGYEYTVGWSTDTYDWTGPTAEEIADIVLGNLSPGEIYLLHVVPEATGTPKSLLEIITEARAQGYEFKTITEMIALNNVFGDEVPEVPVEEEPAETPIEELPPSEFIDRVNTDKKLIALTFDDGEDTETLTAILDNLQQFGVKATFFTNGQTQPHLLQRIVNEGHQLSNHTYSHYDSTELTAEELTKELEMLEEYVLETTGVSTKPYFRAPMGYINQYVLDTVGQAGYEATIDWSVDTLDWQTPSFDEMVDRVVGKLSPGYIYLMHAHPDAPNTPASLLEMIPMILAQGYGFATVEELLAYEGVYEEDPALVTPSKVIEKVNTDKKVVSLTISDGNSLTNLQQILTNLNTLNVKATFFLNGSTDPDIIRQIVEQGHEIGNQTFTQQDATAQTKSELTAEVTRMEEYIQAAAGVSSRPYFRAPMGYTNEDVLKTIGGLGYDRTIKWTTDTMDWSGTLSADQITANVLNALSPGSIYLLHANDLATNTPAALLNIINAVRAQGYELATISDLLAYEGETGSLPETPTEPTVPATTSELVYKVTTDQKVVSLTFSDGNGTVNLAKILDNLQTLNIKGTFFVNGYTSPDLIKRIVAEGHEIGNHTYSQNDATDLTEEQLLAELESMDAIIRSETGQSSKPYFRAPMGATNAALLERVGKLGYTHTIGWTVDTYDWSGMLTPDQVAANVLNNLSPGSIYLMHGNSFANSTPEALFQIVEALRAQGYEMATISDLLALRGGTPTIPSEPTDPTTPVTQPAKTLSRVETDEQVISLTFSDGNGAVNLAKILDNLATLNVKATFFLNGHTDPGLLARIVNEGHELGNHTYSHNDLTGMTEAQITEELESMDTLIRNATGRSSAPYFRAPMGATNDTILRTAGKLGYEYMVGWSADSYDWTGMLTAEETAAGVIQNLSPGSIYLLHANSYANSTPDALFQIVNTLRALGYDFATISDLLTLKDSTPTLPEPTPNEWVMPDLVQMPGMNNPLFTKDVVTDRLDAAGVADPFIVYEDGVYHMFFEVLGGYNETTGEYGDEVAHAYSTDLENWTYTEVVFGLEKNNTRAAYPNIFKYEGEWYMIPDTTWTIQLYKATAFPNEWVLVKDLVEGSFVDTNVFEVDGIWYMTTSSWPYNDVTLFYNPSGDLLTGEWVMHPAGSIIPSSATEAGFRGAGNPFVYEDYVVLPIQVTPDDSGVYGEYTYWYQLSDLSTASVRVDKLGMALNASHDGAWNSDAMHHISHAPYGSGYVYAVDGFRDGEYTIGLFTDVKQLQA